MRVFAKSQQGLSNILDYFAKKLRLATRSAGAVSNRDRFRGFVARSVELNSGGAGSPAMVKLKG